MFGWGYWLLALSPWLAGSVGPQLATTKLLFAARTIFKPGITFSPEISFPRGIAGSSIYRDTRNGGVTPVGKQALPLDSFSRIGHSLFTLTLAFIGGVLACCCFGKQGRTETDTRTPVP